MSRSSLIYETKLQGEIKAEDRNTRIVRDRGGVWRWCGRVLGSHCVPKELWAARDPPTFQGKWRRWDSKEYRRNCLVKDDKYQVSQWLRDKDSAYSAGAVKDTGSIPESGRSPGGGNGNSFWCSCLEEPMDREAWLAIANGVTKSQTQLKWLSSNRSTWTSWKRICLLCFLLQKLIWASHCCGSKDISKNSLILPLPRSRAEFPPLWVCCCC